MCLKIKDDVLKLRNLTGINRFLEQQTRAYHDFSFDLLFMDF